jgi:hypothetical protein
MMTKDEALKMAIEALEEAREQLGGLPALDKLIQDCKEVLKPHPDCDEACMYQCEHERKHKALAQPEQAGADKGKILNNIKNIIADDSIAISYQSMAAYRKYLIICIDFVLEHRSE